MELKALPLSFVQRFKEEKENFQCSHHTVINKAFHIVVKDLVNQSSTNVINIFDVI